jgi:hypothetical protein
MPVSINYNFQLNLINYLQLLDKNIFNYEKTIWMCRIR